jgi:hypothetical protein
MAQFIHLVNDISTPVKLGWLVVGVWSAVQVLWYKRGRIVPGETEVVSSSWSAARLFSAFTRSSEGSDAETVTRSPLSIAPARPSVLGVETAETPESDPARDISGMEADWFDEALRMDASRNEPPAGTVSI